MKKYLLVFFIAVFLAFLVSNLGYAKLRISNIITDLNQLSGTLPASSIDLTNVSSTRISASTGYDGSRISVTNS